MGQKEGAAMPLLRKLGPRLIRCTLLLPRLGLGTSAIGYDVLKMLRQLHRCLAIFNTNKNVTGFHARDSPEFDSK